MATSILVIEDDRSIADMVRDHLRREGFETAHASDGPEGLRLFRERPDAYGLIILDLMLPGLDGIELLKAVRQSSFVPVLILSAKDGEIDKALGLGFGADDYMTKPFSLIELSARVKASLRRANQYASAAAHAPGDEPFLRAGELTLDPVNAVLTKNGSDVKLTLKEWHILKLLMANPKRAFSKEQIYRTVWNDEYYGDENAIQVHVSRLRDKIEDDPSNPRYIKTVWGIGYKLGDV